MDISKNIRQMTILFVVLFIALSGGLVYWQVAVASQVTSNPHNSRSCLPDSSPIRGRILDRNGKVLADTQRVNYGCGYVRHYYDPSLAALIGYYAPGYPATGLEAQFNNYLGGQVGSSALSNIVNKTLHRPQVGADIYLTIDDRIQQIANNAFDTPVSIQPGNTFQTDRGSIVVTDPHTGNILAMVSRPSYDPNKLVQELTHGKTDYYQQLANNPEQPLIERPIQYRYVPGSVYKTATLIAGLDSGHVTLTTPFDQEHAIGPYTPPGSGHAIGPVGNNIGPYTYHFPVDTEYGYTHSDNVIFATIGVNTGAQTWMDYNKRFYVGEKIPFDLPVTPSSVTNAGDLSIDTLAADSFGQGEDFVTPLQMSLFDDVAANDGKLMKPMLVSKIVANDGTPIQTNEPAELTQAQISQQAAQGVRQSMYGVVQCGSGLAAGIQSPWGIIGKTGTGEIGGGRPAQAWFISQAPYDVANPSQLPRLTIVAMKENGGEGGNTNGPLTMQIYNDVFTQVYKMQQPAPPVPGYCYKTGLLQTH